LAIIAGYLAATNETLLHLDPSPVTLAVVAVCVVLSKRLLRQPELGLILLVAFVYLNLSDVLVRFHGLPSILQLLAIPLFLAAWFSTRQTLTMPTIATWRLTLPLVAYATVLLFSSTYASDAALADARTADNVKALAVFFLVLTLASSPARVWHGVLTVVASATLLASIGVAQALSGSFDHQLGGLARIEQAHIHGSLFESRLAGPLGDPNFFAQILIIAVPLALAVAWSEDRWTRRGPALACAAILGAAIVLTYSRGGALALGIVLVLTLWGRRLHPRRIVVATTLLVFLLLILPSGFTRRLTTLGEIVPGSEEVFHPDSSFENRRLLVNSAWHMFQDHPVLGVGAGNYTRFFPEYADRASIRAGEYEGPDENHYPHNLYLEIAAETGLVGLAVFVVIVFSCFWHLARASSLYRSAGHLRDAALARGLTIALVGFLASSLFLHGHFPRYLWLLFGLAAALYRTAPRPSETRS
jgi:O-antigen ligase